MSLTVSLGWWLVPAAVSAACFGCAAYASRDLGNDRFGAGAVIAFGFYLAAAVVSLLAWLIWALVA